MDNKKLLKNLQEIAFYDGVNSVLNLLNKYSERLVFVKSSKGLRNVLFLCERNAKSFDSRYFLHLHNTKEENSLLSGNVTFELDVILVLLEEFLNETDFILYVEIGFACSHPNQNTMTKIYQSMLLNKEKDIHDVTLQHLEYPSWYDECPHASNILISNQNLLDLKILGDKLHIQAMNDYKKIIDDSLINNDFETFTLYSEKLMKLLNR